MKKKLIGIVVCMLLIMTAVLPVSGMIMNEISEIEKSSNAVCENGDFNLEAFVRPSRKILPRIYSDHIGNTIGFISGATNNGPEVSTEAIVKFEIIKIFGNDTGQYHNETWVLGPQEPNSGRRKITVWYPHNSGRRKFGIFIARTTIEVSDTNPNDNSKSFLFILMESRWQPGI